MDVAEANSGVQKSSTSMAESSQEVSVEKTATGVVEQAVSSQRKVEQSLEKSVQQESSSTQVVQKSVSSSVSDEKPTVKEEIEDKEVEISPPKENVEEPTTTTTTATTVKKVEFSDKREEVKLEDIGENDEDEAEEEVEEEIIEVEGSESGEEVEIVETVVLKKQETKQTQPEIKEDKTAVEQTVVLQAPKPVEKISTPEKVKEEDGEEKEEEEQTVQVKIKSKPLAAKQQEQVIVETQQQDREELLPQNKTLIEETVRTVVKSCTTKETHKLEAPLQNIENQKDISQQEEFKEDVKQQPEVKEQPQKVEPKEEPQEEPVPKQQEPQPQPQPQTQPQQSELQQTKQQQQIYEEQHVVQQEKPSQPQYHQQYQQQQIPEREIYSREQPPQMQPKIQQQYYQPQNEIKQENIKNTLKEIISDIDRVIEQEEESSRIVSKSTSQEQKSDGAGYTTTSQLYERSEFKEPAGYTTIQKQTTTKVMTAPPTVPNINSYISKAHRSMSLPSPQEIQHEESGLKNVDLQKIFTPATDASEILPKNRKLYASSAFYSPSLHPTVEDQVELARRISHSLSDISNQQSKGQSMYVNRKKRSVKWVHEGEGRAEIQEYNGYTEETKENGYSSKTSSSSVHHDKVPLKLVMNPRGQIRDFSSMRHEDFNTEAGLLSPDKCAELVTALHAPTGKGAELFAKRRKKSEKWIVDESNAATHSPSGGYAYGPLKATSPIVPAYSDVGVQRVQLNMHQDQVQDKYAQPRLKLVKTPWEAALETGNASSAFQEISSGKGRSTGFPGSGSYDYLSQQNYSTTPSYYQPEPSYDSEPQKTFPKQSYGPPSSQRELAYKPSVPQGWNAPPPNLPSENASIVPAASAYASSIAQNDSYYLENNQTAVSAAASTAIINKTQSSQSSTIQSSSSTHIQSESQKLDDTYGIRTENFGQTDEDEIIHFMERTKLQQNSQNTVKHDTLVQQSFVNCMAKSPELMVSDARSNYVRYDSTLKELKTAFIKGQDSNKEKHKSDMQEQESFNQVNLRKVKQNPEDHSRLLRKIDDDKEDDEDEEYIKIPVKQLISSFENRKSPVIRQKSYEKPKDPLKKSPERQVIDSIDEQKRSFSQDSLSEEFYHAPGDEETIEAFNGQALYVPPQIPLDSYVPPSTDKYLPQVTRSSSSYQVSSSYQTTSSNQQPIYQSPSSFPTYQPPLQNQSQPQSFPLSPQIKPSAFSYSAAPPKQTMTHWVSHQGPKASGPTTAFDPSPLPYEKLAKFEQPNPDDPYASSYPPPRRLAPPSQSRVRNVSPIPFMSSSMPSKPSYPAPRSAAPAAPTLSPQIQPIQQFPSTTSNFYAPSDDSYSYGSAPSSRVSVDLSQCQNYNTAARGWNQMRDYYRPITFSKPRSELPYTDF